MPEFKTFSLLRALVVDDDPVICEGLAMALEDEGFEVSMHMLPSDALQRDVDEPNVAFIDVVMPGMDGLELATKLKERWPDMEVVFVSGAPSSDVIIRAMQLGAYDFMLKPFQPGDLNLCLTRFHERLNMKRRLQLAEERHATLIQNIPLLIFRLRKDLQIDFINSACAGMLGFSPEAALKTENWFLSRIRMHDRSRVKNVLNSAFSSSFPITVQCRFVHRNGYDIHGIIKTLPAPKPVDDSPTLLDGIFVDISQRVYEERSRVQDEKLKTIGAISEEVAHEIRNPLMSISGFARRLSAKAPDFPEPQIIIRESKRIEKLVERIRGYLSPINASFSAVDTQNVLHKAIAAHAEASHERGLKLAAAIGADLPPAHADPELLLQALSILIGDSIQALDKNESIHISSYAAEDSIYIKLQYSLNAMGDIDPERIYLPYEEGGFGIPNCYRLLKQMGGVLVMTREDGQAAFTARLPVHREAKDF